MVGKLVSKNYINILSSRTAQLAGTPLGVAIPTDLAGMNANTLVNTIMIAAKCEDPDEGILELRVLADGYTADSTEFTDTVHEVLAEVRIWNKYHAQYAR